MYNPDTAVSQSQNQEGIFLDQALALARKGMPVFPCHPLTSGDKAKSPLTRNGFKDADTDPDVIAAWATRWPDALVGLPTGPRTGLLVVDLDVKHGVNGLDSWRALEAKHGPAPETYTVLTGGGGLHLYFLGTGASTSKQLGPNVDTRGVGGYVIVYDQVVVPGDFAPAPAWLETLVPVGGGRGMTAPTETVAGHVRRNRRALSAADLETFARQAPPDQAHDARAVVAGKAWGEVNARDDRLTRLVWLLVSDFPELEPTGTAELFSASCAAVEAEDGAHTDTRWVHDKLQRAITAVAGRHAALAGGQDVTGYIAEARKLRYVRVAEAAAIKAEAAGNTARAADLRAVVRGEPVQDLPGALRAMTNERSDVGAEHLIKFAARSAEASGQDPETAVRAAIRPRIQISHDLHKNVDAATAALATDPDIYQRDGRLVRVVRVADVDAQHERMAAGTPQIRDVPPATLRERLTRVAQFAAYDGRSGAYVPKLPPDVVVSAVGDRGEWEGIRPLIGVIETPSLRPDGTLLDAPGYDAATGYIFAPRQVYPAIPETPSQDDARAALEELLVPWQDFPFRSQEDRFVPVAALLTLVARPAIAGACPAFLFDASTRGSGKSLLARAVTTLAQGREAALMSWPSDETELEKVLGSYALRGASVIAFDNVASKFGGAPLDKCLTCSDRVELRVLGKSEAPALAWRAVMLAGGNNLDVGGDTTRRVLVCRLEPGVENPEERTDYRIKDLAGWCRENHPRLVAAALTILRGYVVAGRPAQGLKGWGSFEAWQDLIGSAVVWAGGQDVTACRPTVAGVDDAETGALRLLLANLREQYPHGKGFAVRELLGHAYPSGDPRDAPLTSKAGALREALETLAPPRPGQVPDAIKIGKALQRFRARIVGGLSLDQAERDSSNASRWRVIAR